MIKPTPHDRSRRAAVRIRRLRLLRDLSTQQVANTMARRGFPIGRAAISQIENGTRKTLTIDEVVAFAEFFGVSIASLIEEGILCEMCKDQPPVGYRCLSCGGRGSGGSRA